MEILTLSILFSILYIKTANPIIYIEFPSTIQNVLGVERRYNSKFIFQVAEVVFSLINLTSPKGPWLFPELCVILYLWNQLALLQLCQK